MKELSDKELLLIMNRYGYNFDIHNGTVDSKHHSYKKSKRISTLEDVDLDDDELKKSFEQFKQDLDLDED